MDEVNITYNLIDVLSIKKAVEELEKYQFESSFILKKMEERLKMIRKIRSSIQESFSRIEKWEERGEING